jgi:hypothetical protein
MSSDPSPTGFGQFQSSAIASAQWNNWAHHMLANSNNSQAIQAAMAAQQRGYNQHQLYPQSVPSSGVPNGPWVQSPWGPWVQPHTQQTRFQQQIAPQFPGPPTQMLHGPF